MEETEPVTVIVRITGGAIFETIWIPLASFKAIRLGSKRLQRCPFHHRWEIIRRVDPSTLSAAERAEAARRRAGRMP